MKFLNHEQRYIEHNLDEDLFKERLEESLRKEKKLFQRLLCRFGKSATAGPDGLQLRWFKPLMMVKTEFIILFNKLCGRAQKWMQKKLA